MSDANNIWIDDAWSGIIQKVMQTSAVIGSAFPAMSKDGVYSLPDRLWTWTTGFWPGILWLLYEDAGHEPFRRIAEECEAKLDQPLNEYLNLHHDIGFIWQLTSINNYRLTGNPDSRKRALIAASHLAGRFNIKGRFLRAWNANDVNEANPQGLSIIDSSMNLPILFFAARELNAPRFEHIARAHAGTVLREFIRPDASVNHMVEFDPFTGDKLRVHGGQGFSPTSAWSRGTSWAIHGMATMYTMTRDQIYLDAARKVADFFISSCPEDHVPHWDFRVEQNSNTPRDTSAAACAACGMLEISRHLTGKEKEHYYNAAANMVKALAENYSNFDNESEQGLLSGGTFNHPQGLGIDISLIYGDYYFTEAISRLRQIHGQSSTATVYDFINECTYAS